jgi:hypothetical protein
MQYFSKVQKLLFPNSVLTKSLYMHYRTWVYAFQLHLHAKHINTFSFLSDENNFITTSWFRM